MGTLGVNMQGIISQFSSIWAFAGLVFGFSFLIFIHELGHHLMAKWVGIKVTQFAIGFGPSVFAWRKGLGLRRGTTEPEYAKRLEDGDDPASMGETEYRLNWVPLGGYVKMLGQEDLNPEAGTCEDERSFNKKPIWARACVVSAGVVMNLIFGVIFFVIAFMAGVEFPPAIVGGVMPGSPAATTHALGHDKADDRYRGLKAGDRITHINDETVTDFADMAVNTALASPNETLRLTVQRDGESKPLVFPVTPREDEHTKLLSVGIARPISLTLNDPGQGGTLPKVLTDAGVGPGMRVVSVDGQAIKHYGQFELAVADARGQPVSVVFTDPDTGEGVEVELAAAPRLTPIEGYTTTNLIGLAPAVNVPMVVEDSPAMKAGMQDGDILARLGSVIWPTWEEIPKIVRDAGNNSLDAAVLRAGELVDLEPIKPRKKRIGISYVMALHEPVVARTLSGTPAASLELNAGSRILSIDGHAVNTFGDIQRLLAEAVAGAQSGGDGAATGVSVAVRYQANIVGTAPSQTTIQIAGPWPKRLAEARWGQPLGPFAFKLLNVPLKADNPIAAAGLGIKKAHQVMLQTYVTLLRLFQGTVKPSHLRGPIGIADDGTNFAKQGWSYLMFFLGLISINLVVINFLPIPIVDGGLMVFLIIEKIKGSPVSVRVQTAATMVGLAMIGSVFLLTLFYDAKRLLGL